MSSPLGDGTKKCSSENVSDDASDQSLSVKRQTLVTMALSAKTQNNERLDVHQKFCVQRRPSWNEIHDPRYHGSDVAHVDVYCGKDLRRTRSCHDLSRGQ